MAISFVASSVASGTGTATPAMPPGATAGDLLILLIEGEGEDTSADSAPTGGAWTAIGTGSVASATDGAVDRTRLSAYWAWYDAGINRTVPDAGNHTHAVLSAWRGVDSTTPFDGVTPVWSSSGSNSTSFSVTGVTGVSAGAAVVAVTAAGDDVTFSAWTNSNLTGLTEVIDENTLSGSDGAIGVAWGTLAAGGASGATTGSVSASEEQANVCFALRPAAAAGGGITFDAVSDDFATSTTTLSWSHTVANESDRVLFVAVACYIDGGGQQVPSSVTYNGVSMTYVDDIIFGASNHERLSVYRLVAPATGTNTVAVTMGTTHGEIVGAAISYYGVDQTTPIGTSSATTVVNGTSVSQDISSETDDLVIDFMATYNPSGESPGAGQTARIAAANGASVDSIASSEEAGASTTTMSWSWSAAEYGGHIAFNLNVASSGTNVSVDATPGASTAAGPAAVIDATATVTVAASPAGASAVGPPAVIDPYVDQVPTATWDDSTMSPGSEIWAAPHTIEGFAFDAESDLDTVRIEIYSRDLTWWWNGTAFQAARTWVPPDTITPTGGGNYSWSYTFDPPDLPVSGYSKYWCTARAYDNLGQATTYDTADLWLYQDATVSAQPGAAVAGAWSFALVDTTELNAAPGLVSGAAPAASVSTTQGVALAPEPGHAASAGPAPVLSTGLVVSAAPGASSSTSPAAVVVAGTGATVAGAPAGSQATGPAGTVVAVVDVSLDAQPGGATAGATVTGLSFGVSAYLPALPGAAGAAGLQHVVSAVGNVAADVGPGGASSVAPRPALSAVGNTAVQATPGAGHGAGPGATVSAVTGSIDVSLDAAPAGAWAGAWSATLVDVFQVVVDEPAAAFAGGPEPTVATVANVAVAPEPGAASTGGAPATVFTGTYVVLAPEPGPATAAGPTATVTADRSITVESQPAGAQAAAPGAINVGITITHVSVSAQPGYAQTNLWSFVLTAFDQNLVEPQPGSAQANAPFTSLADFVTYDPGKPQAFGAAPAPRVFSYGVDDAVVSPPPIGSGYASSPKHLVDVQFFDGVNDFGPIYTLAAAPAPTVWSFDEDDAVVFPQAGPATGGAPAPVVYTEAPVALAAAPGAAFTGGTTVTVEPSIGPRVGLYPLSRRIWGATDARWLRGRPRR